MPISKMLVIKFFAFLNLRRFTKAEDILEQIRQKTKDTEWNKGYINALNGAFLALKSHDSYSFISKLNFEDEKELKKNKKEFLKHFKNQSYSDIDRGFFAAWADFMLISIRFLKNPELSKNSIKPKKKPDKHV